MTANTQTLEAEHLDMITRNILSYHFRYASNYDLNLKSDKLIQGDSYFFNELWPRKGQDLTLKFLITELEYPLKGFKVFEIRKKGFQIGNDSVRLSMKLTSFQADDLYLVALDTNGKTLKFISGNFFQSPIQEDFDLDIEMPESFMDYIIYRTFNWSTEKIRYERTKKGKLVFSAYSKYLEEDIKIEINKADVGQEVIRKKKKVAY